MKKTIIGMVVLAMAAGTLTAQDQDRDRIQDQDQTRLLAMNGTMLQVRDQAELQLREQQTLSDGTVLEANGKYVTADGKRYKLGEGECLDGDGALYRNEYQYRNKIERENAGLSEAQVRERNQNRFHYTLVDGEVYQIRHRDQVQLQNQLRLENGTTVYPDGTYQIENRERLRLENGACLDPSGQLFRNMYQHQKMMIMQHKMPSKKMMKKGVTKKGIS